MYLKPVTKFDGKATVIQLKTNRTKRSSKNVWPHCAHTKKPKSLVTFVPLHEAYINLILKFQGLEKLNRELKEEEEEQLPVDISLFPDSIFKGFQASLKCFVTKT